MRIFFRVWAPAMPGAKPRIRVPANKNFLMLVMFHYLSALHKYFTELFFYHFERFFEIRVVDEVAGRRYLLALVNAFLGPKLHGFIEGNLAHQAVFRERLKIL